MIWKYFIFIKKLRKFLCVRKSICTKHSRAFHRIPRDVVSDLKSTEAITNPETISINNTSDANHWLVTIQLYLKIECLIQNLNYTWITHDLLSRNRVRRSNLKKTILVSPLLKTQVYFIPLISGLLNFPINYRNIGVERKMEFTNYTFNREYSIEKF